MLKLIYKYILLSCIFTALALGQDIEKIKSLIEKSKSEEITNRVATEYALAAKKLAEKNKNTSLIIKSNKNLAAIYTKDYQLDKAIDVWYELFILAEEQSNPTLLLESYQSLGSLYIQQDNLTEASRYFLVGLKFARDKELEYFETSFNYYLGELFFKIDEYETALNYFESATSNRKGEKSDGLLTKAYSGKAKTFLELDKLIQAKNAIDTCLNSFHTEIKKEEKAKCLNYAGKIYFKNKNIEKAITYYESAYKLSEEAMDKDLNAEASSNLAELYFETGDLDKSYEYAKKSYTEAKDIGSLKITIESARILSEIFKTNGKLDSAYKYLVLLNELELDQFNLEKEKIVNGLLTKYQAEETARQNKLLSDQIALEQSKSLNFLLIFIFATIVGLIITFFFYYRYRVKSKANKSLLDKNSKIEEQSKTLQSLNEELTNRNEEIETINNNLVDSEALLRESNATKDKFFSIIAHDLKNPISGILLSSDMVMKYQDRLGKDKIIKSVADINKAVNRLMNLLNDLLSWARAQSGTIDFEPINFNIADLTKSVKELFDQSIEQKNITFNISSDNCFVVFADKFMIETVIRNLISNAIKFTPNNGSIEINIERVDLQILFEIKDTGVGIPEEKINELFSITSHYSTTGTNKEKGTGLGLALCKEFITNNHGQISVSSKQGEGSKFSFTIPSEKN